MLLDERRTKAWAKLVKSFGWPDAGELLRQSALTGIGPAIGAFPAISSRIEATEFILSGWHCQPAEGAHAINGS